MSLSTSFFTSFYMKLRFACWLIALVLIILIDAALIALLLTSCTTPDDHVSGGHTMTLPALPACLFFCSATIESTVNSSAELHEAAKPASAASAASAAAPSSSPATRGH